MISTSLNKPQVYESQKIQLISPILHIGSAVSKLSPFEYVQTSRKVYLPNQEALAKALHKQGGSYLNDYIQVINNRDNLENLLEDAFGEQWWDTKDENEELIFPKQAISQKLTEERITDLRPMIRNGMGQLYIPGSSIKGAIRTAIAYYLLKHSDRFNVPEQCKVSEIEKKLRGRLGQLGNKHKQKFADDDLFMEKLFSDFELIYQGEKVQGKTSLPNLDFMRAITVTDSEELIIKDKEYNEQGKPIFYNLPVTAEVITISHWEDWKGKYKAPIYAEMVKRVRTKFTISINKQILSNFNPQNKIPFQTIDDILKICKEFAQDQWNEECYYWQQIKNNYNAKDNNRQNINLDFENVRDIYKKEKCPFNLRVGWASGMNGTTVNLLFDKEFRKEIRDNCSPRKAPGFEAPKSRRVVAISSREIKFVPGWVKFKVL